MNKATLIKVGSFAGAFAGGMLFSSLVRAGSVAMKLRRARKAQEATAPVAEASAQQ